MRPRGPAMPLLVPSDAGGDKRVIYREPPPTLT